MSKIINLIIFLIGCTVGITITYFWGSNFDLGDEINIVDVAAVLTTLFLAFYIPTVLESSRDSKKFIKETIVKRIESIHSHFESISSKVSYTNSTPVQNDIKNDIIISFTRISNELKVLEDILLEVKISESIKKFIPKLNTLRRNYKNKLTGRGFDTTSFIYTPTMKSRETVLITEITKELNILILKVSSWD